MPKLRIIKQNEEKTVPFTGTVLIRDILTEHGYVLPHLCGGRGTCKKCEVTANGEKVLSCRHTVSEDTVLILPDSEELSVSVGAEGSGIATENMHLCLDIGTTTVVLALAEADSGTVVRSVTAANPQRTFGADVISRIEHCMKSGVGKLRDVLVQRIAEMTAELLGKFGIKSIDRMYVSGNTTMLHIFRGVDPTPMGTAPYTPAFLGEVRSSGEACGLPQVREIVLLPGISAFVGADILAGINYVGLPEDDRWRILLDLGTNAEIVLFSRERILCTAAAAGPCFEGANISCGMSAADGAVYAVDENGRISVIGNVLPKGICATGLVDAIAYGLKHEIIEESGYMEDDELELAEGVSLTQRDVREFQLAKSAIRAATECLVKRAGIELSKVEGLYVAGGFSASLNAENAARVGLIPEELAEKLIGINNSSLLGAVRYAVCDGKGTIGSERAEYVDLSADAHFAGLFMEYMAF